jgi:dihydroorotate dehydrogenase
MNSLKFLCSVPVIRNLIVWRFGVKAAGMKKEVFGLTFKNPVGLGAGFDKNAKYLDEIFCLGFGFVEIGTVTPMPQEGNPKPRLFRLPDDKALINRMGFNNDGVQKIVHRLRNWKIRHGRSKIIIGGNIGKNKITPNADAWKDYEICFRELYPYVDYFVVNVSSPNTPGLRELQEKESLRKILTHLQTIRESKSDSKPILLKIAPDLSLEQVDDVIELAREIKLDGLVVANTTVSREGLSEKSKVKSKKAGPGGLSGAPLKKKSTEIVEYISQKTKGELPVIASGGIFTGRDAKEKLKAGAALVQVWTGFIYEGPAIVRKICSTVNND